MGILPVFQKLKGRYEFQSILRQGGMGVIYRAYDLRVKRMVAVKTIRDTPDETALELFERECKVLAQLSHPNIIEIFDVGEFEEAGTQKPYFVMPLLTGRTLEELIRENSEPMPAGRSIEILIQACRGLQSAHEQGLIHRDLKPSNIFVLDDDSVKIIDFGVAHMISGAATAGRKGTPWYMAPEQIELEHLTPKCDQFALGVVSYQMFTGRRPFEGSNEKEVARAILRHVPPLAHSLNSGISELLSQVAAKALGKKPERRWESLSEFAACLRLAYHGAPIPALDPARFQPRIDRAAKALQQGDIPFADEILRDLEDSGCARGPIVGIRRRIDESRRQTAIQDLLSSARKRMEECEYPLALQKVAGILEIDPAHSEALVLQHAIEEKHREEKVAQWLHIAARRLEVHEFGDAREAARRIIETGDPEGRGQDLLAEIDRREGEHRKLASKKEELYNQALGAWQSGNLTSAMSKLEQLVGLDSLGGETVDARHRELYDKVRAEKTAIANAYADAGQALARGDFDAALALCDNQLARYPANALFQAFRIDIMDARRRRVEGELAELNRRLAGESDLDLKVTLLQEAAKRFPEEMTVRLSLEAARKRLDLLRSLASSAREEEGAGNYDEALGKWIIIRNLHKEYPGIESAIARLKELSGQQALMESGALVALRIAQQIESGQIDEALGAIAQAQVEFPNNPEFAELKRRAEQRQAHQIQAQDLLAEGRALWDRGRRIDAVARMRAAQQRDPWNASVRTALVDAILELGRAKAGADWHGARIAASEALALDPESKAARSLLLFAEAHVPIPRAAAAAQQRETSVAEATPPRTAPGRRLETISEVPEPESTQSSGAVLDAPTIPVNPPRKPSWERLRPKHIPGLFRSRIALAGMALVLLLVLWGALKAGKRPNQSVPARSTVLPLVVHTTPPGAEIRVDRQPAGTGDVKLTLSPGEHLVEAVLPGYRTTGQLVRLGPGLRSAVNLTLLPQMSWRLYTDASDARVTFDSAEPVAINAGRFDIDALQPGKHTAIVKTNSGEVRYEFEANEGDAPLMAGSVVSKDFLAVLVKSTAAGVFLLASKPEARAAIDPSAPSAIGEGGLHLPSVTPGSHTVTLLDHGERSTFPIEVRAGPTLTAFVHAGKETGSIVLRTDEAGADIFVNGRKLPLVTSQGETRLLGFRPGKYSLAIAKQGFEPVAAQSVEIVRRKVAELQFVLKRLPPAAAQLAISGAPAGAEVFIDHAPAGAAQEDGSFSHGGLTPGVHSVELRHPGYISKMLSLHFDAGQTTSISGDDAVTKAEAKPGTIHLSLSPPEAIVTLNRPNEAPRPTSSQNPITLPKGNWVFTAQAAGYDPLSVTVTLGDGETKEVPLKLIRKKFEKNDLLAGWQHRDSWIAEGMSYVREGGGYVLFDRTPITGSVVFTAALRKGKRLRWTTSFRDEANYSDFELDRKYFARYETVNGKRTRLARVALDADINKPVSIQILIQKGSLHHFFSTDGNHWREIDLWSDPSRNFTDGRFGFILQGKDTVVISKFSYLP